MGNTLAQKQTKNINRGLRLFLVLFIALSLNLIYLSAAIQYGATDKSAFDKSFKALDSRAKVGLNEADFNAVEKQLIDYVGLKTETFSVPVTIDGKKIDFFNDKERAHMVDVRSLFVLNDRVLKGALVLILTLYLLGRYALKQRQVLIDGLAISGAFMMVFVLVIGILASQDFTAVFTKFHELFFTNDLWLLDPATDRMIVLLEEQFFLDMAVRIGQYTVLLAVIGTAVGFVGRRNSWRTLKRRSPQ